MQGGPDPQALALVEPASLVELAQVVLVVLDRAGRVRYVNPFGAARVGLAREAMIGRDWFESFVPARVRADVRAAFDAVVAGGPVPETIEHPICNACEAGSPERIVVWRGTTVRDPSGTVVGVLASGEDVTDRRRAEETLRASQTQVLHLVESLGGIVWEGSPVDWTFTFVSQQAERILGWPRETWIQEPDFWVRHIHPDDRDRVLRFCAGRTAEGLSHQIEYRMLARDGRVVWLHDTVTVVMESGRPCKCMGVMIDVTERMDAEQQARRAADRLRACHQVLLDLARRPDFVEGPEEAARAVAQGAARALQVAQVGVWRLSPDGSRLENMALYERAPDRFTLRGDLLTASCPVYMSALETGLGIATEDVLADPRTREFRDVYLIPNGITSMLDVPIRLGGRVVGILCHEHIGPPRLWSDDEKGFAATLADRLAVVFEAAERQRAERQAREVRTWLKTVVDHAPVIVLALDAKGALTLLDGRGLTGLGLRAEGVVGRTVADVFGAGSDLAQAARRALAGETLTHRIRLDHLEFETRWIPLRDSGGDAPSGAIAIAVDVTDRLAAERELERHRERLEEMVTERTRQLADANKDLESFSSSVAHDLRAPLRAIDGFTQLVLESWGDSAPDLARAYLSRVQTASSRMGQLIDDLLVLSRVGLVPTGREPVDLTELARAVGAELAAREPDRKVDLRVAEGLRAQGDPGLLRIVFENLLSNAWKFTGMRDVAHVEVGRSDQNGHAFFVRDDGAGFEPGAAGRLFRPFSRLHPASAFPGTGLGLATVARIVGRHGGKIWAEGAPDRGATVWFTLG